MPNFAYLIGRGAFLAFLSAIALSCVCVPVARAQVENEKDETQLTLERVFDSDEFSAKTFEARWLEDRAAYTTLEDADDESDREIVLHDPVTGKKETFVSARRLVPAGQTSALQIDGYTFSKGYAHCLIYTNSRRVWRKNTRGDYWVLDRSSYELRRLGGDAKPSSLMFAKFSPDGKRVAYVRENDIFVEDLVDRTATRLTQGKTGVINGTFDWVYEEEFSLRDGFRWSPDGQQIAYWQIDTRGMREFSLLNNTDGLYPRVIPFKYPKAGQRNPTARIGIVDLKSRQTKWLKLPGDAQTHYIVSAEWTPRGKSLAVQQLNRLQNNNQLMLADVASGKVATIQADSDDAWVEFQPNIQWLADGEKYLWQSERGGWRRLYVGSVENRHIEPITTGDFDVIRYLHINESTGWCYFLASPENPTQRYLFRARLDGTSVERLTPTDAAGSHDYQISSDGQWAIHRSSTFGAPPTVELVKLPGHEAVRQLEDNASLREKLEKLTRGATEFFRVPLDDGPKLDAWRMLPSDFDASQKYPLLVYVYGEPAGQTVLDQWGGKRYLWHLLLTQRGYVVMSFDNRGTPAPRGRQWRKCIYRQVGILAPRDQAAATRAVLKQNPYLDAERVGIWGWSGGGSMSLNAIFKFADLYHTAMAVAPVANQRYYDSIYQERYMGLPDDNVQGYRDGSAINFADRLKGDLLLVHGTGDDNVHYQATEALINELVRHKKRFSLMAYPNRTHSIREGKNTSIHLRQLMTDYLKENLTPGGRSQAIESDARMIVIAHRGASGYLPEHTLPAKAMAYAMGADYLEQDVVLTKDDVPIVLHDIHLDTVTDVSRRFPGRHRADGRYYALDFTLEEVQSLRANERIDRVTGRAVFPDRFPTGTSRFMIPTLAEEIELIQGLNRSTGKAVGIYPEIKQPAWHRREGRDISVRVLEVLTEYDYVKKSDLVYLQCFDIAETKRIRNELKSQLRLIQLIADSTDDSLVATGEMLSKAGLSKIAEYADGIGPSLEQIVRSSPEGHPETTGVVRLAHELGLEVHAYTLRADQLPGFAKTLQEYVNFLDARLGIDGIFADHPDQAVRARIGR